MKTKAFGIFLMLLSLGALSAKAVDPTAEWYGGEFGTDDTKFPASAAGSSAATSTKGGLTITKNNAGNTSTADYVMVKPDSGGWPLLISGLSTKVVSVVVAYTVDSDVDGSIIGLSCGNTQNHVRFTYNTIAGDLKLGYRSSSGGGNYSRTDLGKKQPTDDKVHYAIMTYNGSGNGTSAYFDGVKLADDTGLKEGDTTISEINLGAVRGPSNIINGIKFYYVAVYNSNKLSDDEAQLAYLRAYAAMNGASSAILDVNTDTNDAVISANEDTWYRVDSAATYNTITFNVADGKTLTLMGANLTAENGIFVNGVVAVSSATALAGSLSGNGTLTYNGAKPTGLSYPDEWQGVLCIKNSLGSANAIKFSDYGNSGSTLRLDNVQMYVAATGGSATTTAIDDFAGTLDIGEGGMEINNANGYTLAKVAKLTGAGEIKISNGSQNGGNGLVLKDVSGFTGNLTITSSNRYQVTIGDDGEYGLTGKIVIPTERTVTIPAGSTWSTVKGIENHGTLIVNGTLSGPVINSGTVTVNAGATLPSFDTLRDFSGWTVAEGVVASITQTAEEYGKGITTVTGAENIAAITVIDPLGDTAGTIIPATSATLETAVKVDGKATWCDYEMAYESGVKTGFENTGTDTAGLNSDSGITGDDAFYNGMLYTYAHPWRNISYPASGTWTAVVRCTVPNYENAAVITFGTQGGGLIGLVAGADPETQMKLVKTTGNSAFTVLATMNVQNATTAQHVYIFSVENNSTIKVYCDGSEVLNETFDAFTLGGGIQVGSVHGGVGSTGIVRFAKGESPANTLSETEQKNARIDCVRLYQYLLSDAQVAKLSEEFPAVKLFRATVASGADTTWGDLSWSTPWDGGNMYSKIILTVEGHAKLTLPASITAEDFTINVAAGKTLTLVEPDGGTTFTLGNPMEVNEGSITYGGLDGFAVNGTGSILLDDGMTVGGAIEGLAKVEVRSGNTVTIALAGSIANTIVGAGTINSPVDKSYTFGDWTGVVALPEFVADGVNFGNYGKAGSTIALAGITSGWIAPDASAVAATLKLDGPVNFTAMSTRTYTFAEITGTGDLAFSTSDGEPTVTITKVAEGYEGTISSTLANAVNISVLDRKAGTSTASGTKLLSTSSNIAAFALTIAGEATGIMPVFKDDGLYALVASVTKEGETEYYNSIEEAIAELGNDAGTLALYRTTDSQITLYDKQTLKNGNLALGGVVSAATGIELIQEGNTYTAIDNRNSIWSPGSGSDNAWSTAANWSTGRVPQEYTAITFPESESTVIITDYNSEAHKCASMAVNGDITFMYTANEDYWPEVTLYGDVSGTGKLILKRAGLRNLSDGEVTISCAFGVQYNHTTNDSFLRGNNFKLTGAVTVDGFLKIEEGTEANLAGATEVGDGSKIQANDNAVLTLADVTAGEGTSATITAISGGTVTVAKLTGSGDVSLTNGTVTLLDDYTGTLGGSLSIITVNKTVIDTEEPVVKVSGAVNNVAEIAVTENGTPTTYRLYAKADGNLYVKTPIELFRKSVSGDWLDANSWTNSAGETVDTEWISANLIYATIDADIIESITIGGSDTVEMAKLTIVGGAESSVELAIEGAITIDQHLNLSGMAGTIVKAGEGVLTAVGDNVAVSPKWTVEAGTLSLGGAFDSIGGNGTVVTMNGGVLDIAGAHGGSTIKKLVMNGEGAVFTNSVDVGEAYVYNHSFPFSQIEVDANCSFGSDFEWGAIAPGNAPSSITIAAGKTFTKTGSAKFYVNNMAITGEGTLKVAEGVLDKGDACTVDNLEIENWSNVYGGGTLTVNQCVTLNNETDATINLADRSVELGDNATLKLNRAGTLEIGTWRGDNLIDMTEAGGKISLTLTGNSELEITLNVAGLDESDPSNVIINGGEAPGTHNLSRSGNTIHIARNVGGMVINPVTGERVVVKYEFAGEDGAWQTVTNWREYDSTYNNYTALSSGNAPTLTGSNRWDPALFDGSRLASEAEKSITLDGTVEGWALRLAIMNGIEVTVPTINKLQSDTPMWIMVDGSSTLTFNAWGSGNNSNSLTYYVANEDGVTWNMAFNKGVSVDYYLAGAGSVNYTAGVTAGTHSIKRAELTLGAGEYTTIIRRALVKFSSSSVTFDTSELAVLSDEMETPAVPGESALIGTEAVGTYQVLKEATGIYVEYIGRTETAPKEYVISGSGTKTWTWDEPAPGADDTVTIKLTGNMTLNLGEDAITIGRLVVLNEGEDTATLTLSGATLNTGVIIAGEAVEVASSVAAQLAGTLQGSGTVTYTDVMPTGLVTNDNGWKGVLWLKNVALSGPSPETLTSDYSTLRLTGCTGYFNPDNVTRTSLGTLDLRDDGETAAFTVDNGWSGGGVTVFGKLTGDGTLGCATRNISQRYVFVDPSEFTGTINCARTDATSNLYLRVILGDGATLNPAEGTITIVAGATAKMLKTWTAKSIINNGTLHLALNPPDNFVNNGALVLLVDDLNLQGVRDFSRVSVADGVTKVQVDQTQSEYLNGVTTLINVPAEITSVLINKFDGNLAQAVKDPSSSTWKLDEDIQLEGKAALYDFTFTPGKYTTEVTNAGSRGGTLSLDWNNAGTHQFTIAETLDNISGNLNVSKHPYVDVGSYPTEFTVAVYGTMPQNEFNTLIAFGRRPGGFLALVKGETENDVNLIWAKGDGTGENFQNISSMRAKAATEEKHLYVFEKTANSISVYLDGLEKITVTSTDDNPWPLGNNGGFQVGSVLQGIIEGIANRPDEDTDPATIAMIRVYGEKISADVMAALKAAFPFYDEASTSERTLNAEDGLNSWYGEEIGTWTNTPADVGDAGHWPRTNANVTLTVAGDVPQWMSVVLNPHTVDEPNIIGDLHITGSQALTIRKSIGGHPVSVSGILTNDVNLTIHYGAIDLAYTALYLGENGTLTFELSELINDKRDSDRVYLTGVCDNFGTERVTYSYDTTADTFVKFKSLGWDSVTQRYYVDFTAPRAARDVWFDPIPGEGVTNVLSMDMEVYYEEASATKTSPILTGDRLHFKSGSEAVVLVPKGEMALASYDIPAGVTVIFEEAFTNRVSGAGTIVMSGCWPSVSQPAVEDSFTTAANWSGTLEISNVNFGNASLVKLGNASSTIRLSGCSIWPQAAYEVTATLEIDNTTYGYGLHFRGVSGDESDRVVIFDKLAGSGLLMNIAEEAVETHNYLRIKDASEYSGPITNDAAGVTLLFGTGDAAEGSVVITESSIFKLCSPVYASTNLVVNGELQVADPGVVVTAESVSFGTDTITGVISITDPEAYPFFNVEKQITGKIGFSLNNFPAGVSPASIQMMRVNNAAYLPDKSDITLIPGKAADYSLVKDADGRGWSLARQGFYIRIR